MGVVTGFIDLTTIATQCTLPCVFGGYCGEVSLLPPKPNVTG